VIVRETSPRALQYASLPRESQLVRSPQYDRVDAVPMPRNQYDRVTEPLLDDDDTNNHSDDDDDDDDDDGSDTPPPPPLPSQDNDNDPSSFRFFFL